MYAIQYGINVILTAPYYNIRYKTGGSVKIFMLLQS